MKKRNKIHDNWKTSDWLLEEIRNEFGDFFDPCPLNADFDGLALQWGFDKPVYINPPYSRKLKEAFINKACDHAIHGGKCVMLLPVSTSTKIFHEVIKPNAKEIRFLRGRVNFEGINSKGEKVSDKCGMHDSMIVIF